MKTPLSWINIYTPIDDLVNTNSITHLAHSYSIHTAEIDDIIPHFLDKVVVGKVISCEKHPDSKKLSIVKVNLGEHGEETILTGAPNIIGAKYVPVAMVGAVLGGDFVIGERKMAGMMSRGMICAEDEVGLVSTRADGILELEKIWDENTLESMIGKSFFDLKIDFPGINGNIAKISLKDTTFEIDNKFITNRPDLFSIIGNAREWAVIFDKKYTSPFSENTKKLSQNTLSVDIQSDKCLAYSLLETDNLSVAKSPLNIQIMMERAGLNPKLDIVDVTNLILTEYGQPMHAFDADKITGNICVRLAKKGESILALDGQTYNLDENDLVIADQKGPVAIAGVIGGAETAVSESTTRVFWESATFDATSIRLTAQRHGIRTDASTRYEKSLDPTLAGKVFERVLQYLHFLKKEPNILAQFDYIDTNYQTKHTITIPVELVKQKAGIGIDFAKIETILTGLGFEIINKNETEFEVLVPTWRATKDVSIAEDIIEEIIRIFGYDNIPNIPLSGNFTIQTKNQEKTLKNTLLQFFVDNNWNEVYNYSFTNIDLEEKILSSDHSHLIAIQNAYTEDFTHMRSSLAPRLLINIANNLRHQSHLQFFEIGKIYGKNLKHESKFKALLDSQDSLPYPENTIIAGACTQKTISELKSTLGALFTKIIGFIPQIHQGNLDKNFLHPGVSGAYIVNDTIVAQFGKIHPKTTEAFEIPDETLYFEIHFETLFDLAQKKYTQFATISPYQPISRDINFVLDKTTETGFIVKEIASVHPWIHDVAVDSVYEDEEKLGKNKKSVVFTFVIQSPENTITDEEAKHIQDSVISHIETLGFKLRGI